MKAVNLLPSDYKQVRQASFGTTLAKHPVALGGTAAAVAVAALLGLTYQSASHSVTSNQNQLDALHARIAAMAQPVSSVNQSVRARIEQVTTADATRMSWDGFMTKLARVLPEDVWLTNMSVQETAPTATATPTPAAPAPSTAAPTGFTISGFTYSQHSVARLMRRLSLLPWLSDVTLQTSSMTTVGTHSVFQFTIVGAVTALPAKEAS
jgi:Tfp pilus assembly protein PilN